MISRKPLPARSRRSILTPPTSHDEDAGRAVGQEVHEGRQRGRLPRLGATSEHHAPATRRPPEHRHPPAVERWRADQLDRAHRSRRLQVVAPPPFRKVEPGASALTSVATGTRAPPNSANKPACPQAAKVGPDDPPPPNRVHGSRRPGVLAASRCVLRGLRVAGDPARRGAVYDSTRTTCRPQLSPFCRWMGRW